MNVPFDPNGVPPSEHNRPIILTEMQLRQLMTESVDTALARLGLDINNPFEVQKDMQHLRASRTAWAGIKSKTLFVALSVLVTGGLGALWLGLQNMINKFPHP